MSAWAVTSPSPIRLRPGINGGGFPSGGAEDVARERFQYALSLGAVGRPIDHWASAARVRCVSFGQQPLLGQRRQVALKPRPAYVDFGHQLGGRDLASLQCDPQNLDAGTRDTKGTSKTLDLGVRERGHHPFHRTDDVTCSLCVNNLDL